MEESRGQMNLCSASSYSIHLSIMQGFWDAEPMLDFALVHTHLD